MPWWYQQVGGDKSYHGSLVFPAGAAESPDHQTRVRATPHQFLDVRQEALFGPEGLRLLDHLMTKCLVLTGVLTSGHCCSGVLASSGPPTHWLTLRWGQGGDEAESSPQTWAQSESGLAIFRCSPATLFILPHVLTCNSHYSITFPRQLPHQRQVTQLFFSKPTQSWICHRGTISLLRSAFITNISRFLLVGFDAPDCNNGGK